MKITAVVVAYWPSRFKSIPEIVADLRAQTRPPDHILVFNNNHRQRLDAIDGASVVNAGWNYTSRCKYAAAMLEPSDYYVLLDDDLSLHRECMAYYASFVQPGCCFSDCGARMVSNFAHAAETVGGAKISAITPVDLFIGSLQVLSFGAIARLFSAEERCRLGRLPAYRSVGEDFLIALANRPYAAVFPTGGYRNRTSKPQGTAAMQYDYGYYALRDRFAFEAWTALGNPPFPGRTPLDDPGAEAVVTKYLKLLDDRDAGRAPTENHA